MPLQVYNTLTRAREEFVPLKPGFVRMYVCGPTVYGHSHLGHAKSYVSFDVIVRYLRFLGYKVVYVQNITDVGHLLGDANEGEDRVLKQSKVEEKHPMEIAETYTQSYFEDMDALNVLRPDISPRATGHIIEQIGIIENLVQKKYAYEAHGSVYFDISRFDGYGKLSGRTVEELTGGARVAVKSEKRHPADFALWKKAGPDHIMQWPSPWGNGFPGWHIECSAMSMKYLGESFDIHGGGLENQFPHHECEIAQSECATGRPFVKYWLHNNMVTVDGRKMGKSLGNFITLKDAFKKWHPSVIRFFILQSQYRSTLDFSETALNGAAKGFEKLRQLFRRLKETQPDPEPGGRPSGIDLDGYRVGFREAMDDDFNTPRAIAVLFDLVREVNHVLDRDTGLARSSLQEINDFFQLHAGGVLGLTGTEGRTPMDAVTLEPDLIKLLVSIRQDLRAEKLWQLSDKIRNGLAAIGVLLEDTREGSTWRKTTPLNPSRLSTSPQEQPRPEIRQAIKPELPKNVRTTFGEDGDT